MERKIELSYWPEKTVEERERVGATLSPEKAEEKPAPSRPRLGLLKPEDVQPDMLLGHRCEGCVAEDCCKRAGVKPFGACAKVEFVCPPSLSQVDRLKFEGLAWLCPLSQCYLVDLCIDGKPIQGPPEGKFGLTFGRGNPALCDRGGAGGNVLPITPGTGGRAPADPHCPECRCDTRCEEHRNTCGRRSAGALVESLDVAYQHEQAKWAKRFAEADPLNRRLPDYPDARSHAAWWANQERGLMCWLG